MKTCPTCEHTAGTPMMSSYSGRIMKAMDNKLIEARTLTRTTNASNAEGDKTGTTIPTSPSGSNGKLPKTNVSLKGP